MRSDKEKLERILECIGRIVSYTRKGERQFFENFETQDAVMRNLQVIGDAIKDLSDELCAKHPDVDWSEWTRSRDKITHDYFNVDYEAVWIGIERELPSFRIKVSEILEQLISRGPEVRERHSILEERLRSKKAQRHVPA